MDKAMRIKEKQEALDKQVAEINQKNFDAFKESCRVDVANKGEKMDFLVRLHKERREAIQEENILRSREAGELLPSQIEQTVRLAEGVLRLKSKLEKVILSSWELHKEIRGQKHRQVLRSENIELKELETQLKSTYAAKAAQVQLRERQASRDDEKYFENKTAFMQARWYNDDAFDRRVEKGKFDMREKYRNDIQDQLINNEIMRQKQTERCHRERKIGEEISEVICKENMQLEIEKREKIARVRDERNAFFKAREIWKCKEKEAILDEFNRQGDIIAGKMLEEKNLAVKKHHESMGRDSMAEKTARRMLDEEVERKEREDVVREIIIQEENLEASKAVRNSAINREIIKGELLGDMERQKQLVAESKARSAAVDNAFGKYLAEQYETAVKNDRLKDEERRRKGIQYGKDLKAVCEEQRAVYAEEIIARKSRHLRDEAQDIQRLEQVAFERSNMIYEHAAKLDGFLKAGTLRREDYDYIKIRQCKPEKS